MVYRVIFGSFNIVGFDGYPEEFPENLRVLDGFSRKIVRIYLKND